MDDSVGGVVQQKSAEAEAEAEVAIASVLPAKQEDFVQLACLAPTKNVASCNMKGYRPKSLPAQRKFFFVAGR